MYVNVMNIHKAKRQKSKQTYSAGNRKKLNELFYKYNVRHTNDNFQKFHGRLLEKEL